MKSTGSVFINICCLPWLIRGPNYVIYITVNQKECLCVASCSFKCQLVSCHYNNIMFCIDDVLVRVKCVPDHLVQWCE